MSVGSIRVGAGVLLTMLVGSIIASIATPDPNHQDLAATLVGPGSPGHLLGTDQVGRDMLAWIAAGVRTSLVVSTAVVSLSMCVGVSVGLAAGYLGGWRDGLLMAFVDLQLAVPPLLIFIAAAAVITPSHLVVVILLSAVGWVPYARIVRAHVLAERERPYVAASRLAGAGTTRVLRRLLLPAVAPIVTVYASLQAAQVLMWEAGLSFLGFGIQPPTPSLGYMISEGKSFLASAWWITTFAGLTVVLLAVGFNTLGDGLREYFHLDRQDPAAR